MLAPWMTPGVNSPLLRFTAKTSMRRVYDVDWPRRDDPLDPHALSREQLRKVLLAFHNTLIARDMLRVFMRSIQAVHGEGEDDFKGRESPFSLARTK
jgi:hypothetical protein